MKQFYSNGKLLLTGEYLVLDGAKSLALPCKYGQSLEIHPLQEEKLVWESFTDKNELWLQVEFDLPRLRIISETFDSEQEGGNDSLATKLQEILLEARKMNPNFLNTKEGFYIKSKLDFPRNWGLGSSSTLVNNIAQWAKINAFTLQFTTFGGSAYDIACAQNDTPILYQLNDKKPNVEAVNFNPSFKEQLYFVHLNKKQNSREGIKQYREYQKMRPLDSARGDIKSISTLTDEFVKATSSKDLNKVLAEHERIIASIIQQEPIQKRLFSDYFGQTKSLGAWGGDFILATGNQDTPNYFKSKGFDTVIRYKDMVL